MIIGRSPLRISIGGGGTDLPSYYQAHGGFVLSAAITQYVYVTFQLTPLKVDSPSADSVVVSGTASTLFSGFSALVTGTLGVTPFAANQQLGPVVVKPENVGRRV